MTISRTTPPGLPVRLTVAVSGDVLIQETAVQGGSVLLEGQDQS